MNGVMSDSHEGLARGPSRTDVRRSGAPAGRRTGWLADGHVHLHDWFDLDGFLDGAARNLGDAAGQVGAGTGAVGCLCLTETRQQHGFVRLQEERDGVWSAERTLEDSSLVMRKGGTTTLVVLAGRQVVTRERLEVLLLGSAAELPDGEPVERTLDLAAATDGLVVLPWGFGKWTFGRGRIIERLLSTVPGGRLFVGDNGNRPTALSEPRLLRRARELGVRVVPGSDPFPLPSHERRAGRCGVFLECAPDLQRPARQIRELLLSGPAQPETFRQPEPIMQFALSQVAMRMPRRKPPVSMEAAS